MGYNIEVSFNILKHSNVTEVQKQVTDLALNCDCSFFYEDYEFVNNVQFKRTHSITTFNFDNYNIHNLIYFLKQIGKIEGIFLESIYDDTCNGMLYASQYYLTQMMDKNIAQDYKLNKRKRSYSDDDNILNEIEKSKK